MGPKLVALVDNILAYIQTSILIFFNINPVESLNVRVRERKDRERGAKRETTRQGGGGHERRERVEE